MGIICVLISSPGRLVFQYLNLSIPVIGPGVEYLLRHYTFDEKIEKTGGCCEKDMIYIESIVVVLVDFNSDVISSCAFHL